MNLVRQDLPFYGIESDDDLRERIDKRVVGYVKGVDSVPPGVIETIAELAVAKTTRPKSRYDIARGV